MGLGLLGRGVGDAAYMAEAGAAEVIVTDLKTETELADSVEQLRQYDNVRFVLGEHREEDFLNRDLILVAAGVPADSMYLNTARAVGVPLKQSAALFAELAKIPIIGVTGTRGKSTVTHMIHHVLSEVTGEHIILGGNVRGVSNLQLLKDVQEDSLAVMELDSWQLQGWGWAEISPQIAVFTSFMPDHLDYYGRGGKTHEEAMAMYFADKPISLRTKMRMGCLLLRLMSLPRLNCTPTSRSAKKWYWQMPRSFLRRQPSHAGRTQPSERCAGVRGTQGYEFDRRRDLRRAGDLSGRTGAT